MLRKTLFFASLLIIFSGCATSMEMRPSDVKELKSDEGVVFGSILIRKLSETEDMKTSTNEKGGKVWTVNMVDSRKSPVKYSLSGADAAVQTREGLETPFVTKLAAGEYRFIEASAQVFAGTLNLPLNITFRVDPGRTVYIGKLVIEMPQKMDKRVLGIASGTSFTFRVEDSQEATAESLKGEYGEVLEGAVKELMAFKP